ncbi:hypothetical protein AB0P21_10990 [Kribbella sp. NPDC056861]|uniref:hypothetical protein n=1 Tax=Kribbella sp. NPDC056861 TaxID=3154857 RepID=UPI003428EC4F
MMRVPSHFIRRTAAVALTTGALAVALQIAPASAGHGPFHTIGPFSSQAACNDFRIDLESSGIAQQCFLKNGSWYFKFAQEI